MKLSSTASPSPWRTERWFPINIYYTLSFPLFSGGGRILVRRRPFWPGRNSRPEARFNRRKGRRGHNAQASLQEGGAQGMFFCPIRAPTHTKKAQARNPQAERLPRAQGKASGRGLCAPCPRNSRPAQGRRAATFAFRRSLQRLFRIRAARLGAASARFHPAGLVGKFLRLTGRSGKAWQRRANRRHMGRRKANRPGAPALTGAAAPYANAKRPFRIPAGEGAAQRAPAQWQRLPDAERAAGSAVRAWGALSPNRRTPGNCRSPGWHSGAW